MRVKKVINNSIICAIDEKGHEMIVTGKGIGFQRKKGERIDESKIDKTYHMEDTVSQRRLSELVEQIPLEHLQVTQEMIEVIKTRISQPLNESLLITMADHISFAIKRKEDGIVLSNPLAASIMSYYPTEYNLGQYCLKEIREKCGVELAEDEAAFIALHIVNAELNTNMSVMYDITNLIEGTLQVVECYYGTKLEHDSLDFNRFVVHLRYFAQRLFRGEIHEDAGDEQDEMFRQLIAKNSKEHYKCAKCIGEFISNTYHKQLSDEELTYLTIHLRRINPGGEK